MRDQHTAIFTTLIFASTFFPTYEVFGAYSITSEFLSGMICETHSGSSVHLQVPISFPVFNPNSSGLYQVAAESSIISLLGLSLCTAGGENQDNNFTAQIASIPGAQTTSIPLKNTPSLSTTIPTSIITNPSASQSTTSNIIPKTASTRALVAICFAAVFAIILFSIGAYFLYRYRKNRLSRKTQQPAEENDSESTRDAVLYLQPKPEVSGEDSRHEMPAEGIVQEISAEQAGQQIPSRTRMQELKGEEISQELGA